MHLVVHHVAQLDHVDHADRGGLVEALARLSVVEVGHAEARHVGLLGVAADLVEAGPVENRRGELHAQLLAGPSEDRLVNLAEVHPRRHAQRVEHDVDRGSVLEERHVLLADDPGHDALVSVATGHLVPHLQLALVGDEDLGQLHDARGELVPDGHLELLPLEGAEQVVVLQVVVVDHTLDQGVVALVAGPAVGVDDAEVQRLKGTLRELHALLDLHLLVVVLHALGGLAADDLHQLLHEGLPQCGGLLVEFSVDGLEDGLVRRLGLAVLDHAGEEHLVDDDPVGTRSELQGGVLHVSSLVTEDGAKQLLLRARVALALRRDLSDEDVPGADVGTDADQAVFVEVLGGLLAHVRDVRGQFLLAALGVADLEAVLGHV